MRLGMKKGRVALPLRAVSEPKLFFIPLVGRNGHQYSVENISTTPAELQIPIRLRSEQALGFAPSKNISRKGPRKLQIPRLRSG